MNLTPADLLTIIYFGIGFLIMCLPVFDSRTAKNFDHLSTGAFMIGCMIVWVLWPMVIWFALKNLPARGGKNER